MISKISRFTTKLFDRCFRKSSKFRSGSFIFLISEGSYNSHLAVVVGKKVSKKAVERNRVRRQLYEAMRLHLLPRLGNKNIICLYKGPKILENLKEFEKAIKDLLNFLQRKK